MTPVRRRLWLLAWPLGLAAVAAGDLGFIIKGVEPYETLPLDIGVGLASVVTGLLVWARHPRNRIGPLLYAMGALWALSGAGILTDVEGLALPGWWVQLTSAVGAAPTALLIHVIFAYPSGRLLSLPSRIAVALGYLAFVLQAGAALFDRPQPEPLTSLLFLALALAGVATMSMRWYRARPLARRMYTPVLAAGWLVAMTGLLVEVLALASSEDPRRTWVYVAFTLSRLLLPIGFLVGMTRSRLDRAEIGDLVVALAQAGPSRSLQDVLAGTLHDPSLQVAYWMPERKAFVDMSGEPVDVPVESSMRAVTMVGNDEEDLAAVVHDPALREDSQLIEAAISAARMAIERERLAAQVRAQLEEVRASRARIVEASDAERRRVERNLHDGAQQRLVALAMRLQLAKDTSTDASALLDETTAELRIAIGEVRDLARGLHPTILTEAGLGAALEALAERAPLPVRTESSDRRYAPSLEATAYFVVAEALTNVARHAGATEARVGIVEDRGRLIVNVTDDGCGGADLAGGSGLRGLADRVAVAGGILTLTSPPGHGTLIRAEFPLA
jgi:signal transduction histidine kinase